MILFYKTLFRRGEVFFSDSTKRADPILGEVFKGCSGSDSVVRIADCRVIFIPADIACVLFHRFLFFKVFDCIFKQRLLEVGLDVPEQALLVALTVAHLSKDLTVTADDTFDGVARTVGIVG